MIFALENGLLQSDLDAANFDLLNLGIIDPVPTNLVENDDPRLSDARAPLPGSVVNASVSNTAAIQQSKLNLNGAIPAAWLGITSTTAARGDLAEYKSKKGQPSGYAPLDGSGKVPATYLPTGVGTGTVTSVGITMPAEFTVTGSPVTSTGTIAIGWAAIPALSWFGNDGASPAVPAFRTTPLPVSVIPGLDASKISSGVLAAARLPVAIGLGLTHAPGAAPDPGDGSGGALATDYLARDMTYKPKPTIGPTYQPTVPNPAITPVATDVIGKVMSITDSLAGTSLFYSTTSGTTGFAAYTSPVSIALGSTIWAYGAKLGYNNSSVVSAIAT
jgi:hypothetical protein